MTSPKKDNTTPITEKAAQLTDKAAEFASGVASEVRTLRRSRTDRKIAGVCGGVAAYLGVDATVLRILLVVATLFGFGLGALLYVCCWLLMPEAD